MNADQLFDSADRLLLATTWLRPTILLLDDDPSILEIARYALGQELRVVTIESPLQLFETLDREQPVVLLFEARLPSFDAIAFTRLLRGMPAYRDLPVIAPRCEPGQRHAAAAYDAGIDEMLTSHSFRSSCARASPPPRATARRTPDEGRPRNDVDRLAGACGRERRSVSVADRGPDGG